MEKRIIVEADTEALCYRAAKDLLERARACADRGHPFHIALAGGSTPEALYRRLAEPPFLDEMPWEHLRFFFGDERMVPPDHPDSNYRMAREALLGQVPLAEDQIHRIEGELEPETAARRYE